MKTPGLFFVGFCCGVVLVGLEWCLGPSWIVVDGTRVIVVGLLVGLNPGVVSAGFGDVQVVLGWF